MRNPIADRYEPVRFLKTAIRGGVTIFEVVFVSAATARPRRRHTVPDRNRSSGHIAHLARLPVASAVAADLLEGVVGTKVLQLSAQ